jgi:hypothetical protein
MDDSNVIQGDFGDEGAPTVIFANRRSSKGAIGLALILVGLIIVVNDIFDYVEKNFYYGQ